MPRRSPRAPKEFAPRYAVCPNCRERAPLPDKTRALRCDRCRGTYDVDWKENYLGAD